MRHESSTAKVIRLRAAASPSTRPDPGFLSVLVRATGVGSPLPPHQKGRLRGVASGSCAPEGKAYDPPCHSICLRCEWSTDLKMSSLGWVRRCALSTAAMTKEWLAELPAFRTDKFCRQGFKFLPDSLTSSPARAMISPSPSNSVDGCAPGAGVNSRFRRQASPSPRTIA